PTPAVTPAATAGGPRVWEPGEVILGEFDVERQLGRGGVGAVYLVRSRANGSRFAVKRALVHDDNRRRQFLTELVTWQDLPEPPFLAPFRFFRTIADEVVIFTDFVDGGTLADWITGGRLTRLEDMLDVAIQFAWGLHVAHEAGMIHRDVKPHNALMTADGQLKGTDFGLARCRFVAGAEVPSGAENIVVSSAGRTPAYASPEQCTGRVLSRQTDIWSWAVSVLDVFVGRVPSCRSGTIAPQILQGYLASGPLNPGLPRMPQRLADVLRLCVQPKPAGRWFDLGGAAARRGDAQAVPARTRTAPPKGRGSHPERSPGPDRDAVGRPADVARCGPASGRPQSRGGRCPGALRCGLPAVAGDGRPRRPRRRPADLQAAARGRSGRAASRCREAGDGEGARPERRGRPAWC